MDAIFAADAPPSSSSIDPWILGRDALLCSLLGTISFASEVAQIRICRYQSIGMDSSLVIILSITRSCGKRAKNLA